MTRTDIIQRLIDKYDLKSYLEIGVFQGENFNKIRCDLKHSIDPEFPATFQMTSDEFFSSYPSVTAHAYSMVFIDGMHTAEQTYKDIDNAFGWLCPQFIVVHDCNPITKWHTRPPEEYKRGEEWNGDTYKGFIDYKEEHPELTCFTIDADYGCGIITDQFQLDEPADDWDYFDKHRKELLQLISVDEFNDLI